MLLTPIKKGERKCQKGRKEGGGEKEGARKGGRTQTDLEPGANQAR